MCNHVQPFTNPNNSTNQLLNYIPYNCSLRADIRTDPATHADYLVNTRFLGLLIPYQTGATEYSRTIATATTFLSQALVLVHMHFIWVAPFPSLHQCTLSAQYKYSGPALFHEFIDQSCRVFHIIRVCHFHCHAQRTTKALYVHRIGSRTHGCGTCSRMRLEAGH